MVAILNALLIGLKFIEVLAVLGILAIGADYVVYEIAQSRSTTERIPKHSTSEKSTKLRVEELLDDAKARLRQQKEDEARAADPFFEDGYFNGFDSDGRLIYRGSTAPSNVDWDFFAKVDARVDADIFENTKEL